MSVKHPHLSVVFQTEERRNILRKATVSYSLVLLHTSMKMRLQTSSPSSPSQQSSASCIKEDNVVDISLPVIITYKCNHFLGMIMTQLQS
mmetsp:Transcript_5174/g.5893  ORF Transcript_5174/g.5893 Transcript_5174/m.5893 type:complete len:90 (-) Transcript_5174:2096-2365(-)